MDLYYLHKYDIYNICDMVILHRLMYNRVIQIAVKKRLGFIRQTRRRLL